MLSYDDTALEYAMLRSLMIFAVVVTCPAAFAFGQSAADAQRPLGSLVVCGGGRLPTEVISRFVALAGGKDAKLVVIPTAASDRSLESSSERIELWKDRGVGHVTLLHTRDSMEADSDRFPSSLKQATAVWFGGGQQSRIADAYLGTATEVEISRVFGRGGVIGGTSAGAAIQSRVMIRSGRATPDLATGFDLFPAAIIDQHFLKRNRANRLLQAIRAHPTRIGIGIDEDTAIVVRGGVAEVLGLSCVFVITTTKEGKVRSLNSFPNRAKFRLDDLRKPSK